MPDLARAGVLESMPGFRRKDPRIRTLTYRHADAIRPAGRPFVVQRFTSDQAGRPAPPDFAPFVSRALAWAFPQSAVFQEPRPDNGPKIRIQGRIDLFHRFGSQGLRVEISACVLEVSCDEETVLWLGAKKADWIRRYSTDDCLLLLADDFVATWTAEV